MGFGYGFDIRQISGSPWATLSLSIDTAIQSSILRRSYFMPSYTSSMEFFPTYTRDTSFDYLLDPKLAWEQTTRRIQENPIMYMTPSQLYTGGSDYIGGLPGIGSGLQLPSLTWPGQSKPETAEEKEKREAKEKEDKKQEAKDAKALNERFDQIKKTLADLGSPLSEELIKKAEAAMKEEKAEDRLKAMQDVMKLIPDEKLLKCVYANDDIKSMLVDAGFNLSKYIDDKKLYTSGNDSNGARLDWRSKEAINDLYQKLKKDSSKTPSVNFEIFVPFAAGVNDKNILGIISNWNDVYHSSENKSILRHVANNLPSISNDSKKAEKEAAKSYVGAIENLTKGLLTKADNWTATGDYAKLKADRDAVQSKLNALTADTPNNLTKEKVNALADAFDKLYARLRIMEAERINQAIQSKFKDINDFRPGFINEKTVIEETQKDLKAENITIPEEIDEIQKAEELLDEENERIDAIGPVTRSNVEKLVKEGQLEKVQGKEDIYRSSGLYKDAAGAFVSKDKYDKANGEAKKEFKPLAVQYYKLVDDKLVPMVKGENGKYTPDTTKQVTSSEIRDYNTSIQSVQDLIEEGRINWISSVKAVSAKYPLFKAVNSENYFIWRNDELVKIKNVESINANKETQTIMFKIEGVEKPISLEQLYENDDNFDTFIKDEIKTTAEIKQEEDKKAAEAAKKAKEAAVSKITKESYDLDNNGEPKIPLKDLGLETTYVKGWYKTKAKPEVFFYYDNNSGHLVADTSITRIYANGVCSKKGSARLYKIGEKIITPEKSAKELHQLLEKTEITRADADNIRRKLNTFITYRACNDILTFLKTYNNEAYRTFGRNDNSLCKAIYNNKGLTNNEKKDYIKYIAKVIKSYVEARKITFKDDSYQKALEEITKGNNVTLNNSNESKARNLETTADALDKIIKYIRKNG